jgi:putative transposase
MPRLQRVVIPGCPHHITQRGNRRQRVFVTPEDYEVFGRMLRKYAEQADLAIQAYCLMPNHVHIVAVPASDTSLSRAFKPLFSAYTRHFNVGLGEIGRLWQGRFFSCPLDDSHLLAAVRYVERNPVRAGLVSTAEEFAHSSAAAHVGLQPDELLSDPCGLTAAISPQKWAAWLGDDTDPDADAEQVTCLRRATHTGRVAGSVKFITQWERILKRHLTPKKHGRPKKQPQTQ